MQLADGEAVNVTWDQDYPAMEPNCGGVAYDGGWVCVPVQITGSQAPGEPVASMLTLAPEKALELVSAVTALIGLHGTSDWLPSASERKYQDD